MKLFQIFNFLFGFTRVYSFTSVYSFTKNIYVTDVKKNIDPFTQLQNWNWKHDTYSNKNTVKQNNTIITNPAPKNKIQNMLKLMRSKNIIPSALLCFSGGWIMNPSIDNLMHSAPFIVSTIDTILIMSASMVINDIYDFELDKINSPDRPLPSGVVSIPEAFLFSLLLLGTTEYLTFKYLPDNLQLIIQLVIIQILIYTPILKQILFIKNVSCASLIAFSLFLSGLSASNILIDIHPNLGLLSVAMSIIFFGSLSNEILLDIRDKEGDHMNKITTIPTLLGIEFSWIFSFVILNFNIISNSLSIMYLYQSICLGLFIPIIFSPLFMNSYQIKKNNYSREEIVNYMHNSNYPLIVMLLYLCLISLL